MIMSRDFFNTKASYGVCPPKNPCLNSGICVNSEPVYKCVCSSNFSIDSIGSEPNFEIKSISI